MATRETIITKLKFCFDVGLAKEIDELCRREVQVGDMRPLLTIYHTDEGVEKIGPKAIEVYEFFIGKVMEHRIDDDPDILNCTHWEDALAAEDQDR